MVVSNLYGTVTCTSTQASNLLYMAMNYESFKNSEYIIFQDEQYSYYIVWGDLYIEDGVVKEVESIEYIHYYRSGSSNYDYTYVYEYGTDTSFDLYLDSTYQTTSNIPGVGFVSMVSAQYNFYSSASDFYIFGTALLFVVMICALRGTSK